MEEAATTFLYKSNAALEVILVLAIIVSFFKPQLLTTLSVFILLIRPNERMEFSIPFMKLIMPVLTCGIILNYKKYKQNIDISFNKYLWLFIMFIMLQTLIFRPAYLEGNIMFILIGLLLYLSILLFMPNDDGTKLLCGSIIFSCFLICLEPLYYHYTEPQGSSLWKIFHIYDGVYENVRLQAWGMWDNANELSFLAFLGVANSFFLAAKYKTAAHYAASALLIPFFMLVLFLTASRSGFASLLIMFFPLVFIIRRRSTKIGVVVFLACTVLAAQALRPSRTDISGSTEARTELREKGMRVIAEAPIKGVGFGLLRYEMGGGVAAHNVYLQAFAETGMFGGALLLLYLSALGKKLVLEVMERNKINTNLHIAIVLGIYCSCVFFFFWSNQLLTVLFFLVMSLVGCLMTNSRQVSINAMNA